MSGAAGMRILVAAATDEAMRIVVDDGAAMDRCKRDSDAILEAVRGTSSASANRAETWLAIAMTLASIASVGGREAPMTRTREEQLQAALGMVDGVAAITAVIVNSLFDNEGSADVVKH